jgi:hypothetical protein
MSDPSIIAVLAYRINHPGVLDCPNSIGAMSKDGGMGGFFLGMLAIGGAFFFLGKNKTTEEDAEEARAALRARGYRDDQIQRGGFYDDKEAMVRDARKYAEHHQTAYEREGKKPTSPTYDRNQHAVAMVGMSEEADAWQTLADYEKATPKGFGPMGRPKGWGGPMSIRVGEYGRKVKTVGGSRVYKDQDGQFAVVPPRASTDDEVYFTDDKEDAYDTAATMDFNARSDAHHQAGAESGRAARDLTIPRSKMKVATPSEKRAFFRGEGKEKGLILGLGPVD